MAEAGVGAFQEEVEVLVEGEMAASDIQVEVLNHQDPAIRIVIQGQLVLVVDRVHLVRVLQPANKLLHKDRRQRWNVLDSDNKPVVKIMFQIDKRVALRELRSDKRVALIELKHVRMEELIVRKTE